MNEIAIAFLLLSGTTIMLVGGRQKRLLLWLIDTAVGFAFYLAAVIMILAL